MLQLCEGSILLASLIGYLSKTETEGIYKFEHKMMAPSTSVATYQNYLQGRLQHATAWPSSAGCAFEPVGDIVALPGNEGFNVLVKATVV